MLTMSDFQFDSVPEVNPEIVPALEMFNYNRFRLNYHIWKFPFLDSNVFPMSMIQLPWDSTYHTIDNFELGVQQDFPKVLVDPLIKNEAYNKWIYHAINFNLTGPVFYEEKYTYITGGMRSTLNTFRSQYKNMFRYLNDWKDMPNRKESLTIINYNPLFRVYTYGMLRFYKKAALILTTVMNTVAQVLDKFPQKHQYILIPWDNSIYARDQFTRTMVRLDSSTIKYPNSFHYIFMVFLLNWASTVAIGNKMDHDNRITIFDTFPKRYWEQTNFVLRNGDRGTILNMADIAELNIKNRAYLKLINHCNLLSSSTPLSTLGGGVIGDEAEYTGPKNGLPLIVDTKPTIALPDITKPSIDTTNILNDSVTDGNKEPASSVDTETPVDTTPISVITDTKEVITKNIVPMVRPSIAPIAHISPNIEPKSAVAPTPPVVTDPLVPEIAANITKIHPDTDPQTVKVRSKAFVIDLDNAAKEYIIAQENLTPKQKERATILSTKYKQITFEDKTIEDILLNSNDVVITDTPVPGIVDVIPDKSMANSTVFNFDNSYIQKTLQKDLISTAVEFNRIGMFLTDVKTTTVLNELTHAKEYSFHYEDVNGKKHTIKFSIPIIDSNGYCYVNGVKKLLKKQMVNIPICKIGENKVSMVSNYNKVLVFRNTAKAHSFLAQMDKVIDLGKEKLDIVFGTLDLNIPLAYEYTILATKYNTITLRKQKGTELWDSERITLCFDYYNRYKVLVEDTIKMKVDALEKRFGVLVGKQSSAAYYFMDVNNRVSLVDLKGTDITPSTIYSVIDIFKTYYPSDISAKIGFITEWIDLNLVSKPLPVGFVLAFKYGLVNTLNHLGVKYKLLAKRGSTIVEDGSVTQDTVVATEVLNKIKDPGNGVFFLHKNQRPKEYPQLKNINNYYHTGIIYKEKVYECFNGGRWAITDVKERLPQLKKQHAVFITPENTKKVKIDEKKLESEITSGTSCSTYVARVIGLDDSTGDEKTMYPDDVFNAIWNPRARLPMLTVATESNKIVDIEFKKKWKTQEISHLELLEKYGISKDKIVIGGSAAMVAHRYPGTNKDIDGVVDPSLLSQLKSKYKFTEKKIPEGKVLISPCGNIEVSDTFIIGDETYDFNYLKEKCSDKIEDYYFLNLPILYKFYLKMNRPKDQDKIRWLTKYHPDAITLSYGNEVLTTDKYTYTPGDIVIKFKDCNLVFNRYPLAKSLIVAGLDYFNTQAYNFDEFNTPDVYYSLMEDRGIKKNYLKAVKSFFDLFVDPITRDILEQMKEPTNVRDLLIRASVLLTTQDHKEASAIANHRIRSYEQFVAIAYNQIARGMASFQAGRGKGNVFSVNPNAIFQQIIQNPSFVIVEDANPLQELKDKTAITFSGIGGRTSESFVVDDRRYPTDGVGVISEATVDNQKVAMNSCLTVDPSLVNTRGLIDPKALTGLHPTNLLSVTALTMPCSTNDDRGFPLCPTCW